MRHQARRPCPPAQVPETTKPSRIRPNPSPNSRLPQPGLYYTTDDGKHWRAAKQAGIVGSPASLAVHPSQDKVVALGTRSAWRTSHKSWRSSLPWMGNTCGSAVLPGHPP